MKKVICTNISYYPLSQVLNLIENEVERTEVRNLITNAVAHDGIGTVFITKRQFLSIIEDANVTVPEDFYKTCGFPRLIEVDK